MSDFNSGGGYSPMPSEPYGQQPGGGTRGAVPAPVANAVRLMFARVAISVIDIVVVIATKNTLKREILDKHPEYSASKLNNAVNAGIAVGVVIGIIFIVLYTLLALQVQKGKNWARIVTWFLAGLGIIAGIGALAQTEPGVSRALALVVAVIDIAIIVLLTRPESNAFFKPRTP